MITNPSPVTAARAGRRLRAAAVSALGATAFVTLTAVATAVPAEAANPAAAVERPAVRQHAGPLRDLQPSSSDPLDGAAGRVLMAQARGATTFVLFLSGVGSAGVGRTYGAHLHTGPCLAGDGAAAGPHYNQSTIDGVVPPVVSAQTEVWLDVTIRPGGNAVAVARVPFIPKPGNRSIVLHAQPTDDHGTAGARLACLPVSWP